MAGTGGFFAWAKLLRAASLPPTAKHVGLALALYADAATLRGAHPGIDKLVKDTGLSQATVRRGLTALAEAGFIVQRSRGGSRAQLASRYDLVAPDTLEARSSETNSAHSERSSPRNSAQARGNSAQIHGNSAHSERPSAPRSTPRSTPELSSPSVTRERGTETHNDALSLQRFLGNHGQLATGTKRAMQTLMLSHQLEVKGRQQ